jgi:hypothetical protein
MEIIKTFESFLNEDNTLTYSEVKELIGIGFDQPKHYKPSVWNSAKKIMDECVVLGLVQPHDFGRGKGKYTSDLSINQVVDEYCKIKNCKK